MVHIFNEYGKKEIREKILLGGIIRAGYAVSRRDLVEKVERMKSIQKHVKKGEILLGCTDLDFEEPVTLKYDPKERIVVIVSGQAGSGKTVLAQSLFEQMIDKFGLYGAAVDPKGDCARMHEPLKEEKLVERLRKFGIQPKGFKVKIIHPEFMKIFGCSGYPFSIGMKNINTLSDKGHIEQVMDALLDVGISGSPAAREVLKEVIYSPRKLPDKVVDLDGDCFYRRVMQASFDRAEDLGRGKRRVSLMLPRLVKQAYIQMRLSDVNNINFPYELVNNDILVLRSTLRKEKTADSAYIATFIDSISSDRLKFLEHDPDSLVDKPIVFLVDEADVVVGREKSPSQECIEYVATKDRRIGNNLLLVTQNPQRLNKNVIAQAQYFITSKIFSDDQKKALRERGVSGARIEEIYQNLSFSVENPVKEFNILTPDAGENSRNFFPIPSMSSIIHQSELL